MNDIIHENELLLYDILHNPYVFDEFITPVDETATTVMPFKDWFEVDRWGKVRLYQIPSLPWDHSLPRDVPVDSGGSGVDKISVGNAHEWGGRNTSKSFGLVHDAIQTPLVSPGDNSLVTSRDDNHLTKRLDAIWMYVERHPFYIPLIVSSKKGDPYARVEFWNGHVIKGIFESTSGEGDPYIGSHFNRANFDEFQLTGQTAWEKFYDARHELGCVVRTTGVSDGRVDTPAHATRRDADSARHTYRRPQFLNSKLWNPQAKVNAIENYGGIDSQGYKTNVLALEGEPMSGVWDIEQISNCFELNSKDKSKLIANRRKVECPVVRVSAEQFVNGLDVRDIILPPDRNSLHTVWVSLDVGKRRDPTVVGIWGLDENQKPHLWGLLIFLGMEYDEQSAVLLRVIKHYGVQAVGIDTTEARGDIIARELLKDKEKGYEVVSVNFGSTVEVPELDDIKNKNVRRKNKDQPMKKLGVKYYATTQLAVRYAQLQIALLYHFAMLLDFQTEVSKSSTGRFTSVPETYHAPQGGHFIDMVRVLEMMFFYIDAASKGSRRKRKKNVNNIGIRRWV